MGDADLRRQIIKMIDRRVQSPAKTTTRPDLDTRGNGDENTHHGFRVGGQSKILSLRPKDGGVLDDDQRTLKHPGGGISAAVTGGKESQA